MWAGVVTVNGSKVGTIEINLGDEMTMMPDVAGYVPSGRAEVNIGQRHEHGHYVGHHGGYSPSGKNYAAGQGGSPFRQGSEQTDAAIVRASKEAGVDANTMRAIASIESSMNPSSNANRSTQYKGLYQIGREEWRRFGEGNIYSAEDNARATARMFSENKRQFRAHFGRDPTDAELYMIHQQGLGFYTRGAMTNIAGNPYPGMRGPQSHESFEAGWGREVERRKRAFARAQSNKTAQEMPKMPEDL